MKKIFIIIILFSTKICTFGFNIISIDDSLIAHQKAFKDFEPHASACEVDVYSYGSGNYNITEYNYDFASRQAKKSFLNYRKTYGELRSKINTNSIFKALIFGAISSFIEQNSDKPLFTINSFLLNILVSIIIVETETINKNPEPYFIPQTLKRQDNLFGVKDINTLMRIGAVVFTTEMTRFAGYIAFYRYKKELASF